MKYERRTLTLRQLLKLIADGKMSSDFEDYWTERLEGGLSVHDGIRDGSVGRGHSRKQGAYRYVLALFNLKADHEFKDNDPLFDQTAEVCVTDGGWLQKARIIDDRAEDVPYFRPGRYNAKP